MFLYNHLVDMLYLSYYTIYNKLFVIVQQFYWLDIHIII